jgi:hypothetical protein
MASAPLPVREIGAYRTLRRLVGALGMALPVVLAGGCMVWQRSVALEDTISDYYGTIMRNVLVGTLFTVGWFLWSYRGYESKDDTAGNVACVFALGVALFPATSPSRWVRWVHFASATLLFLTLAYFALVLFTKQAPSPTPQKLVRNRVYVASGVVILLCIAAIALYSVALEGTAVAALRPVFWLESLALWAFGFAWLVKGETLWRDAEAPAAAPN